MENFPVLKSKTANMEGGQIDNKTKIAELVIVLKTKFKTLYKKEKTIPVSAQAKIN